MPRKESQFGATTGRAGANQLQWLTSHVPKCVRSSFSTFLLEHWHEKRERISVERAVRGNIFICLNMWIKAKSLRRHKLRSTNFQNTHVSEQTSLNKHTMIDYSPFIRCDNSVWRNKGAPETGLERVISWSSQGLFFLVRLTHKHRASLFYLYVITPLGHCWMPDKRQLKDRWMHTACVNTKAASILLFSNCAQRARRGKKKLVH